MSNFTIFIFSSFICLSWKCSNHLSLAWQLLRLFVSQMAISGGSSTGSVPTSWTIWNRHSLHASCKAGVWSIYLYADFCWSLTLFRCTVSASDLDAPHQVCHLQAHTELLVEWFELENLWEKYGLVGNIIVCKSTIYCTAWFTFLSGHHSPLVSPMLISANFFWLTSCIN